MEQFRDTSTGPRTRDRAINKASATPLLHGAQVTKRKPIPRKGHKKSRAGCLVCKRRKVKCDEVTPSCGPCERLGLGCSYPQSGATPVTNISHGSDDGSVGIESPSEAVVPVSKPLQSELASFTLTDLKFFQHFLFAAYPTLPVGGWEVWQDVSQLAHQGRYDFLIHAMLGLGASHLGMLNNQVYMKEALGHRVKAIKSLNHFLSQGYKDQTDADAAFAAVLSLTFQSAYISDGLADFLSMIRGCEFFPVKEVRVDTDDQGFVVGVDAINETALPRFRSMSRAVYIQKVKGLLNASASDASLDLTVIQGFCTSLKNLRPLCETPTDVEYIDRIHRVAVFAATDPLQAYLENSHLYSNFGDLSNEDFARFSDPKRPISRLIIMHLLCLDLVMSRKEIEEGDENRSEDPSMGNWDYRQNMAARWVVGMQKELPEDYQDYGLWVAEVSRGFRYSCEGPNETWRPFMLHKGKATMRSSRALQHVPEHLTCFEERLPEIPYLVNDVNLPLRPATPV